ncbi:MAG: hypothetical protein Ct9H300mP21_02150 [Pseudomonadota bacterium]|nr:MAG: hypothetical protein Ct9H300mP21_02150 [Pseudomonadota bacterium]
MDDGAKRIGEFGVGANYGISRYCYDLLFDEKIGGTVHIAWDELIRNVAELINPLFIGILLKIYGKKVCCIWVEKKTLKKVVFI